VSEHAAREVLDIFVAQMLANYRIGRNRPDQDATSKLSPYLHFGQISPKQVWRAVQVALVKNPTMSAHAETYLQEILWREFAYHTLARNADFAEKPLNKSFEKFPFVANKKALVAWQKGQTGYPIVDAGMRQLWQTGWMHNRVRMIVGSFLVKDLLISWREGARWFWDTLVDADLASNSAGWQWIAGCGVDAAPYFRIFNPLLQAKKFDPHGDYVRRYVPELAKLAPSHIHEPWLAPQEELTKAGIKLGSTYPEPIVDHSRARCEALNALSTMRGSSS
jgi:deoxyribodipyrimidine photo-lyase